MHCFLQLKTFLTGKTVLANKHSNLKYDQDIYIKYMYVNTYYVCKTNERIV